MSRVVARKRSVHRSARGAFLALGLLTSAIIPPGAMAEGALVVGVPAKGLRDGFAFGYVFDRKAPEEAIDDAMKICHDEAEKVSLPHDICKLVDTFTSKCVAVAMDPVNKWAGWAIAPDKKAAERQALANCRKGAKACKLHQSDCD